jgi:integral membrane sensor domain MASE1
MNNVQLFDQFPKSAEAEPSHTASAAGYLLPDSFPRWTAVMLLCFVASCAGLLSGKTSAQADILWPPNGILLAFLIGMPRRFWASYLVGSIVVSLLAHEVSGFPVSTSWIFTAANTVEILLAVIWLAPRDESKFTLTDPRTLEPVS